MLLLVIVMRMKAVSLAVGPRDRDHLLLLMLLLLIRVVCTTLLMVGPIWPVNLVLWPPVLKKAAVVDVMLC